MSDTEYTETLQERVVRTLAANDLEAVVHHLEGVHPSDLADVLESLDSVEQQAALLRALPPDAASEALTELELEEDRAILLSALEPAESAGLISEMADDDAADVIAEMEPEEREAVLAKLSIDERGELEGLLRYGEETAGGIMTTSVVTLHGGLSAAEAIETVRHMGREMDDFFTVFVTDAGGRLLGTVPLGNLILADPTDEVETLVEPVLASVTPEEDQEEAGRLMSRYNLVSLPVITPDGVLLGRITFDDVIDVIEAERTEDILKLAGVDEDEELAGGWQDAVRSRLPWLMLNLLTSSLAATVVLAFQATIEAEITLAFLMPIIAALGGNTGTQALAVTVRRLTLSAGTERDRPWNVVKKELAVGLVNGAALGVLGAFLGFIVAGSPMLGLVVLLAMWGNMVVAGFAGAFVPTLLARLGVDPAVASSVFVHTFTDLVGFFLLLGLATMLLL